MLTNKTLSNDMVKQNFISLNLLFNSIYRKEEVVKLIKVFKIYDSKKNKSQNDNVLTLMNKWFNIKFNNPVNYETIDDEDKKHKTTEQDLLDIMNLEYGVPTMYMYFLHTLRSETILSFIKAYETGETDTVVLTEDIKKIINILYDSDRNIFETMIFFFQNFYAKDVVLTKDFEFPIYRKYFSETVYSILDFIINEDECQIFLDTLNIIKSGAISLYGNSFQSLFGNSFDEMIKATTDKKTTLIQSDFTGIVDIILESARKEIKEVLVQQEINAEYIKYNNTIKNIVDEKAEKSKDEFEKSKIVLFEGLKQIENYTSKITPSSNGDNSKFVTNFDNFFNNFFNCLQTGQSIYLENMEKILNEDVETLNVPFTFYYKTVWYIIAILGTKFGTTNLQKSQDFIHQIKTFNWENQIKNKSGEEVFKDKFWKYFAAYANYMNEGYSQYNTVLKDKGFQNMQKMAVSASKILSESKDPELENIKKEIHKIFYEKIDLGFTTVHGGIRGATQNIADLLYELSIPIELTFNKNVAGSFFEEIKNAANMCIKGLAIEAIYTLCFTKFDFLGNCSLFDLINKLRYYNEIMKNAATLKIEDNKQIREDIIKKSEEYLDNVKNGFNIFNQNPSVKNNCFWFVYQYIYRRNNLFGYEFNSVDSDWWRKQISSLNDKESSFIYLSYISYYCKKSFDPTNFLQSYNTSTYSSLGLDDASKKTYQNINAFFGLKGYSSDNYKKLGIDFINKGVLQAVFGTEQLNNFYATQINKTNRDNIMPMSFRNFSSKAESEFSLFFTEITEIQKTFIDEKMSSFNDDTSIFLMRFAPTIQLLLKNIPSFSSIINLDNIIIKFEDSVNYLLLFVNDSINKMVTDLSDIENKYILELMNKKYYYMAQAMPVAIDYIYKLLTSNNFSFATLIKQAEKSTIDFEDLEELEIIYDDFEKYAKDSVNKITISSISKINKTEYFAVKKVVSELSKYNFVYVDNENNSIYFNSTEENIDTVKNILSDKDDDYKKFKRKILIETIKEYVAITSEREAQLISSPDMVKQYVDKYIKNNTTIGKTLESQTITKIDITELQKSIKDNFVQKQLSGSKNIIEISNEAKQEKINLRFDLYK